MSMLQASFKSSPEAFGLNENVMLILLFTVKL